MRRPSRERGIAAVQPDHRRADQRRVEEEDHEVLAPSRRGMRAGRCPASTRLPPRAGRPARRGRRPAARSAATTISARPTRSAGTPAAPCPVGSTAALALTSVPAAVKAFEHGIPLRDGRFLPCGAILPANTGDRLFILRREIKSMFPGSGDQADLAGLHGEPHRRTVPAAAAAARVRAGRRPRCAAPTRTS